MDKRDAQVDEERPLIARKQGEKTTHHRTYVRMNKDGSSQRTGAMLVGWRGIAVYMGVSKSTAYRWYRNFELPVVRLVGMRVFTTRTAIDRWVERMSLNERRVLKELGLEGKSSTVQMEQLRTKPAPTPEGE